MIERSHHDMGGLPAGKVELDAAGEPTGVIRGNLPTLTPLFARVAKPDAQAELAGTRAFFQAESFMR